MPEQKKPEADRQRKAKLESLIEHSSAVHFIAEASGDYGATFMSGAVETQQGYKPSEFTQDATF
jgi:hypothetical protein